MKTIFTSILFLFLTVFFNNENAQAQMYYNTGTYYAEQGSADCQCAPAFSIIVGYDYYGRAITQGFQDCRERRWNSWYGGSYGNIWVNGYWQTVYENRYWWTFNWYDFRRRVW